MASGEGKRVVLEAAEDRKKIVAPFPIDRH